MKQLVFTGGPLTAWGDWQRRFPDYAVANLGISGETVEGLLARRDRIRARVENPDTLFLMTGINNIASEQYDILVLYRELVRNFTTWYKRSTVVVQSILPVELTWISPEVIRNTNRQLEQLAKEYRAKYLDVYRAFVDDQGNPKIGYLQDDGVHLGGKGYEAWAKEVAGFLKR